MFRKYKALKKQIRKYERYIQLFEKRFNVWPQARDFVMYRGGEYFPDYNNPQTMQEKLNWVTNKYYLNSPLAYFTGNKVTSKIYFADKLGSDENIVKTYGVYNSPDEIDWNTLPDSFAIKTTMGWRGENIILVKDKKKFNPKKHMKTMRAMTRALQDGTPCPIIIEQLLSNFPETDQLKITDYKFFCFNGEPIFVRVHSNDKSNKYFGSFDKNMTFYSVPDYKKLPITHNAVVVHDNPDVPRPKQLNQMIEIARKLSQGLPIARVDLYVSDGHVYVGELTIQGGVGNVVKPVDYDYQWGDMIVLPTDDEIKKLIEQDKVCIKRLVQENKQKLESLCNYKKMVELL